MSTSKSTKSAFCSPKLAAKNLLQQLKIDYNVWSILSKCYFSFDDNVAQNLAAFKSSANINDTISLFQWKRGNAHVLLFEGGTFDEKAAPNIAQCSNVAQLIKLCLVDGEASSQYLYEDVHPAVQEIDSIIHCNKVVFLPANLENEHESSWKNKCLHDKAAKAICCLLWDLLIGLPAMFTHKRTWVAPTANSTDWIACNFVFAIALPFIVPRYILNPWEEELVGMASSTDILNENEMIVHEDAHNYVVQQQFYGSPPQQRKQESNQQSNQPKKQKDAARKKIACNKGPQCPFLRNGKCIYFHPDDHYPNNVKRRRTSNSQYNTTPPETNNSNSPQHSNSHQRNNSPYDGNSL